MMAVAAIFDLTRWKKCRDFEKIMELRNDDGLAMLSIEATNLNKDKVIENFAQMKARKVTIKLTGFSGHADGHLTMFIFILYRVCLLTHLLLYPVTTIYQQTTGKRTIYVTIRIVFETMPKPICADPLSFGGFIFSPNKLNFILKCMHQTDNKDKLDAQSGC